jgi:hypothetical protein
LRGLSKNQALEKLNEILSRWVDIAMQGEHHWVIPVVIICGGGNQVLPEVLLGFIANIKYPTSGQRASSFECVNVYVWLMVRTQKELKNVAIKCDFL